MNTVCWAYVFVSVVLYFRWIRSFKEVSQSFNVLMIVHLLLFSAICYKLATVESRTSEVTYKVVRVIV